MDEQLIQPTPLIIGYTVVFMLVSIGIGWYANKYAKTAEGFFGGTKMFGGVVIGLASMAAVMSAFGFIGGPGLVYKFGFTSIWMTIACGPGFAYGYWVIGKRMRAMADVTDVATLPDIARVRFQSQAVRGILAVGLCLAAIAYLSSQVKGGAKLMNQMLGVSEEWGVAIMFGSTLAYMLVSGMSGSILTDAFQGLVMLIGVLGVIFAFFAMTGGDFSVIMNSPDFGPQFVDGAGAMPFQLVIAFSIIFFIGVMGQPTMLAKMYSVKSHKDLKIAGILGGTTYGLCSLVWILVGYGAIWLVASGNGPAIKDLDKAAFLFVSKTNGVLQALIMAALLAAIVSTASFFISLASGALTRDLAGAMGHEIPHEQADHLRPILPGRRHDPVHRVRLLGRPGRGHPGDPRLGLLRLGDDPHVRYGPSLAALLEGGHCRGVDLRRYRQHRVPAPGELQDLPVPVPLLPLHPRRDDHSDNDHLLLHGWGCRQEPAEADGSGL